MTAAREPGSLLLLAEGYADPERFADADGLARRLHTLRQGAGLDVTPGSCAVADACFPGVLVWRLGRTKQGEPTRTYLAFAAGPGVDTPARLLAALSRTRATPPAAQAA